MIGENLNPDKRRQIIFALLMFLIIGMIASDEPKGGLLSKIAEITLYIPQKIFAGFFNHGASAVEWVDRANVRQDKIQKMQKRLAELNRENHQIREELRTLKQSQKYIQITKPLKLVEVGIADVIGRSPDNWYRMALVDMGRSDGVDRNTVAVSDLGIVGKVQDVYGRFSKVQLIIDRSSGIGAMMRRTRVAGILKGNGRSGCIMENIEPSADIRVGDVVVTSGLGSLFPQSMPVGEVTEIRKKFNFISVVVRPYAKFERLEHLNLVKNPYVSMTDMVTVKPGGR